MSVENSRTNGVEKSPEISAVVLPLQGRVLAGIAVRKDGRIKVLSTSSVRSCEIDDGIPVDFPRFVEAIHEAIGIAVKKADLAELFSLTVGLSGGPVMGLNSRGAVILGDKPRPVSSYDIAKAIGTSGKIELPSDRCVLDVIPVSFAVDDKRRLENPEGLDGARLECESHVLTCRTETIENLIRSVTKSGWKVEALLYDGWANASTMMNENEATMTTLVIDVADRHSDAMLLVRGKPKYTSIFPFGQRVLVGHIARECNVSFNTAEHIIDQHAIIHTNNEFLLERGVEISFDAVEGFPAVSLTMGTIADIVGNDYREFINAIRKSLEARDLLGGIDAMIIGGYGAHVNGLVDLCRETFHATVRQNKPDFARGGGRDPLASRLYGLISQTFERRSQGVLHQSESEQTFLPKVMKWLGDLF